MRMADVVAFDAGAALAEHRADWLEDPAGTDTFLYYAGNNHIQEFCYTDGSRLRRDRDSSIYRVISPDGRVLCEG